MDNAKKFMKRNHNRLMIIGSVLLVVLLVIVLGRFFVCNFEFAADGDQMRGTYVSGGEDRMRSAVDFAAAGLAEAGDLAARGADRAAGYGSSYHIVGEQAYPCNNDPNSLNTFACGVDDYSIWQDGTKKDFTENPIYGSGESTGCHMKTFLASENSYDYDPAPASNLCAANKNPRHTFDINDPFVHAAYKDSNRELSLIKERERRAMMQGSKASLLIEA